MNHLLQTDTFVSNSILAIKKSKSQIVSLIFFLGILTLSFAQRSPGPLIDDNINYISGPESVSENSQHTYTFNNQSIITVPNWSVTGGVLMSTSQSSSTYTAVVQWGISGQGSITFKDNTTFLASKAVTITSATPAVPTMPTITNYPGYTRLTRGNPPNGDIWYWQSTAGGTTTSNAAQYIDRATGSVYYLRAYRTATSQWSAARVVNYTIDPIPAAPPSNKNYVHTITPQIETTNVSSLQEDDKIESITYYDGLGRPEQSIAKNAGGNGEDIITPVVYDGFGRQTKDYLPYSRANSSLVFEDQNAAFFSNLSSQYQTKYPDDFSAGVVNPYSEKALEASPLNRVLEQAAPGSDWSLTNSHTIKFDYQTNSGNEVRNYSVSIVKSTVGTTTTFTPTLVLDTSINNGYYGANTLFKTVTKDENWVSGTDHTTEEFKNNRGQVLLKRTYNGIAHDTYYVYDHYGNLVYVLPPKAEPHAAKPSATALAQLCYQYKYDQRNRLVEKKIPGKGTATNWEEIVYNTQDQPILTRDPNLKEQDKWLFTKYDVFGRVAFTGMLTSTSNRVSLQNESNDIPIFYVTKQNTPITLAGTTLYYNNSGYPTTNITELHTINYYDNYTFDKAGGDTEMAYNITPIVNAKGLITGSKVRVLESSPVKWITTVNYYDEKSRPIYNYSYNDYLQTTDKTKIQLDFIGKVLEVTAVHEKTGLSTITTVDRFSYDHTGRLLTQIQQINNFREEHIVQNNYDELGQLASKNVGGKTTQNRLQNVDYTYNVRGWLKTINNPANLANDLFSFKLNYNTSNHGATALYNGNISETEWRTANTDNSLKWYKYSYDALNRIISGIDNSNNYNLDGLSYDKNGNILTLNREGHLYGSATAFGTMDDLDYFYNGNQLSKVNDISGNSFGFNDRNNSGDDYDYDDNGNMTKDLNKNITTISYNYLNLPTLVFQQEQYFSQSIKYIYDALGNKQKKISTNPGASFETHYAGNFVYEHIPISQNGVQLKFFNHPEGYVQPTQNPDIPFLYVYQFKDHLGNIRLSYSDSDGNGDIDAATEIIQEKNYYPFGLKHKGYNNNVSAFGDHPYGFGGKEEQNELGLGWIDVTARNYDPALGRWMNLDPLAEDMRRHSPYNFAFNNPIFFQDYDGMAPASPDWIPNVDENGTVSYIAEEGDSASTLQKQYGLKDGEAEKIIGDKEIKEGDSISGEEVAEVTGSEVLKLELKNTEVTDEDIAYQMLFSLRNETIIDQGWIDAGASENADYTVNGNDYFSNLKHASQWGAGGQQDGFGTNPKKPTSVNLNGVTVSLTVAYGNSGDGRYSTFVGKNQYLGGKTRMDFFHPDAYSKNQRQPFSVLSLRGTHNDTDIIGNYINNK